MTRYEWNNTNNNENIIIYAKVCVRLYTLQTFAEH